MHRRKHTDTETAQTLRETELLVELLEGRHGIHAEAVADFFKIYNEQMGTPSKANLWARLSKRIALRQQLRLAGG